ncbi:MAG: hypothetical protein EP297_05310 [Gammaproteobacteria bacterium]|nr:MAG: hypothetical protein EP297_05310 [Gammaproteobacteria bacterium]
MCTSEAEMMTFQLYLYARRRKPDLVFDQQRIQVELEEWGINSMRELFDMSTEIMSAQIFPLLESISDNEVANRLQVADKQEVLKQDQQAV